jgi:hypothetical protein
MGRRWVHGAASVHSGSLRPDLPSPRGFTWPYAHGQVNWPSCEKLEYEVTEAPRLAWSPESHARFADSDPGFATAARELLRAAHALGRTGSNAQLCIGSSGAGDDWGDSRKVGRTGSLRAAVRDAPVTDAGAARAPSQQRPSLRSSDLSSLPHDV